MDEDVLNLSFENLLLDSDEESEDDNRDLKGVLATNELENESDYDSEPEEHGYDVNGWTNTVQHSEGFLFDPPPCIERSNDPELNHPLDFYRLFVNDELLGHMSQEINRYGTENSSNFEETNEEELLLFIGVCSYMGLVKLPTLRHYWLTKKIYGGFCSSIMPRDRFEAILTNLHFCNNAELDGNDRLFKIRYVLDNFNKVATSTVTPERDITIDEFMIPFRGRLRFRQYIPNKKHKFGVKLFKVCIKGEYTYKVKVYSGRVNDRIGSVAETVVMDLMDGLLDSGRRLFCDNWYSSISLVRKLLDHRTDFVGTFRKNRKDFPTGVTKKKLVQGQLEAMQSKDGITVMQWHDKRPVFCVSACHGSENDNNGIPLLVKDYNQSMLFVDLSDQMAAYYPFVRKTSKWYVRVFFHLILQTSLVNSWVIYCKKTKKIPFLQFKEEVTEKLLNLGTTNVAKRHRSRVLEEAESDSKRIRRNCVGCYQKLSKAVGRNEARKNVPRVNTQCSSCEKYVCQSCFNSNNCRC